MGKHGLPDILEWSGRRLDFSSGCIAMGVLNVTPDSFSDGGLFFDAARAIGYGIQMAADGAAVIDVGPESTRPGSAAVDADEQIRRAVPVIEALAARLKIPISIDTHDVNVARHALAAGAGIINDITALADHRMAELAARHEVPVILMHMQGTPATMQQEPMYDDVVVEVLQFLLDRAQKAEQFGISPEKIFIDPGIGFGKTMEHNLLLLRHIDRFVASGYRVVVGASRKSFIGKITGKESPAERLFGTAATIALAAAAGVAIVRVHDVPQMLDVLRITNAVFQSSPGDQM